MEVKLVVTNGKQAGTEIPVKVPKFVIGRSEGCQIRPQSHLVSRRHCAIVVEEDVAAVEDLGSTNGTFLNGEKIEGRRPLKNGDRIKVGLLEVEVRLPVAVGGKVKPKVQSIQEAAVRTAAVTNPNEDDFDLSRWLDEEEGDALNVPPAKKTSPGDETVAGTSMTDTATIPVPFAPAKKEEEKKEPPAKTTGKHNRPAKPVIGDTGSAAEDALRHFFQRKK